MSRDRTDTGDYAQETTPRDVIEAFEELRGTDLTPQELAEACDCSPDTARRRLRGLEEAGRVQHRQSGNTTLWWLV
jgi:DNA-binding IclR family transcriptional regulator